MSVRTVDILKMHAREILGDDWELLPRSKSGCSFYNESVGMSIDIYVHNKTVDFHFTPPTDFKTTSVGSHNISDPGFMDWFTGMLKEYR